MKRLLKLLTLLVLVVGCSSEEPTEPVIPVVTGTTDLPPPILPEIPEEPAPHVPIPTRFDLQEGDWCPVALEEDYAILIVTWSGIPVGFTTVLDTTNDVSQFGAFEIIETGPTWAKVKAKAPFMWTGTIPLTFYFDEDVSVIGSETPVREITVNLYMIKPEIVSVTGRTQNIRQQMSSGLKTVDHRISIEFKEIPNVSKYSIYSSTARGSFILLCENALTEGRSSIHDGTISSLIPVTEVLTGQWIKVAVSVNGENIFSDAKRIETWTTR